MTLHVIPDKPHTMVDDWKITSYIRIVSAYAQSEVTNRPATPTTDQEQVDITTGKDKPEHAMRRTTQARNLLVFVTSL